MADEIADDVELDAMELRIDAWLAFGMAVIRQPCATSVKT